MKSFYGEPRIADERWDLPPREKFWLVFQLSTEQVLGWFRSHEAAMRFAERQATIHGYEEYVILEATHSVRQASQPVPEVDVVSLGETK